MKKADIIFPISLFLLPLLFISFIIIVGYQTERSYPIQSINGYFKVDYNNIINGGLISVEFSGLNVSQSYIINDGRNNTTFVPEIDGFCLYLKMLIPKEAKNDIRGSYIATIKLFTIDKLIDYLQINIQEVST